MISISAFILIGLASVFIVVVWVVLFFMLFAKNIRSTRDTMRSLNLVTLKLSFFKKGKATIFTQELVVLTEKLFKLLSGIKSRGRFVDYLIFEEPYVSFEMMSQGRGVEFCISFPRHLETHIVKYLYDLFPEIEISRATDLNPFPKKTKTVFSGLVLGEKGTLPLATFDLWEQDSLTHVFKLLENIQDGEGALVQLLARPAPLSWNEKAVREIDKKFKEAGVERLDMTASQRARDKAARPIFYTNLRLATAAKDEKKAYDLMGALERAFAGIASVGTNQLKPLDVPLENMPYNLSFRIFNGEISLPLSTRELATLYHFAYSRGGDSRRVSEDLVLPDFETKSADIRLGKLAIGEPREVRFVSLEDRFSHFYSIGQTGTGKSALFCEMIKQDMANGRGVAVIDPHGDLIEKVLRHVPSVRVEDVILFDPADTDYPLGLNMLEFSTDEERDFAVQEMIMIFAKLFPKEFVGPVFEHNMRQVLLTLMARADSPGTLAEVPRMLTDEVYAKKYINEVTDPMVLDYWRKERSRLAAADASETLQYIISKLGRFVENKMMRNILGQRKSSFNLKQVIENNKILLVNLAKGKVGEINASLLGLILVSKIQMAAFGQAAQDSLQRKNFFLYIDEFQNFTTDNIAVILSEARKYGLSLNITHQFIGQLKDSIRGAVFGNVGTLAVFRVGPEDAALLAAEFAPLGNQQDFINMGNYEALVKLMANHKQTQPFLMKTFEPTSGDEGLAEAVRRASRLTYGRPKAEVERAIFKDLK